MPAADDEQQPSPVPSRRLPAHDTVCGSGSFAAGHAARGAASDESSVLTEAPRNELSTEARATAAGGINVSPVSVWKLLCFALGRIASLVVDG